MEIELYRMTHIDNIPFILKNGITHKDSPKANSNYINIGDKSLISTREQKKVWITNGINTMYKEIILGDFIPFYFGVRMPMLLVVQHGGNFVEKARHPEEVVYIVCNLGDLIKLSTEFYFSNGHAMDRLTTFYDETMINNINTILDWDSINAQYWSGEENLEIKRKKQAEFLIKGDIPSYCIKKFICYNNNAKEKLENFGINHKKIEINQGAYY